MHPIQTWEYKNDFNQLTISLFEDRLSYVRKVQGRVLKNEFSIKKMLQRKYPLTSVEFDYQIYKKLAELEQPKDLSDIEIKIWQFWKAFNNTHFSEERIVLKEEQSTSIHQYFWLKSKFGFANGYKRANDVDEILQSWQSIADFFFYGPYRYGISAKDRLRIKQEIFNCLNQLKHNLTLQDSFVMFDYDKIKPIYLEKVNGIKGKYIKLEDGRCIVGGWDNPRDGGQNSTSIEYLWYNMNTRVPEEFRNKISYIKSVLKDAIIES